VVKDAKQSLPLQLRFKRFQYFSFKTKFSMLRLK